MSVRYRRLVSALISCHALMREFHLFAVADHWRGENLEIDSVHDDESYRRVRRVLAEQHQRDTQVPAIQVARYEHDGDRSLTSHHRIFRGRPVADGEARETLKHLTRLWDFKVSLEGIGEDRRVEYCREWKAGGPLRTHHQSDCRRARERRPSQPLPD
jgi:stage V sporulation protein R